MFLLEGSSVSAAAAAAMEGSFSPVSKLNFAIIAAVLEIYKIIVL